jgi:ABC-2 type transport system permease protein
LLFIQNFGKISLHLKNPDRIFMISNVKEINAYVKRRFLISFLFSLLIQIILWFILLPLLNKIIGINLSIIILMSQLILKTYFLIKEKNNILKNGINWNYALNYEFKRAGRIRNFLNFFTDVPDNNIVKPTQKNDWIKVFLFKDKGEHSLYWDLYVNHLVRSKKYLSNIVLTVIVSGIVIFAFGNVFAAILMVLLTQISIVYQIKTIYNQYDNNAMIQLHKISQRKKINDFASIAMRILSLVTFVLIIVSSFSFNSNISIFVILSAIITMFLIVKGLVPRMVKNET